MAPDGGMGVVPTEEAGDGRRAGEENMFTTVVGTGEAGFAGVARDVGFDRDFVAWFEVFDGGVDGHDLRNGSVRTSGAVDRERNERT